MMIDAAICLICAQFDNKKIKLLHSVPVAWVSMTGSASPDGATYFRRDIYGLDKGMKLPVRASGRGSSS
jgi:murein L,D-transpeptidase YcbB/YkuD